MNVSYVIKEHIWTSDSDEGTPKKNVWWKQAFLKVNFGKWYHSCGCSDDSQNCEQLKKRVTGKYFGKKLDF